MKVETMRVALIHMGFFYSGGGERTVLSEAEVLKRRGFLVDVFAPMVSGECHPDLLGRVNPSELTGWLPEGMPYRNYLGMLATSILSSGLARKFKGYDCVIAHSQPSYWLASQIKKTQSVPYIAYLHQANRFLYPRGVDREVGWRTSRDMQMLDAMHRVVFVIKRLDTSSVTGADAILVNSEWIKAQVKDCYGVEAGVCYPGVDAGQFKPPKKRSEERYILSTNRHYPQKRLDWFITTVGRLSETRSDIIGVLTGRGTSYTEWLKMLTKKGGIDGRIRFVGGASTEELTRLYGGAAIYSYPSPEEDFGLGPVEAGACGCPSVVWDHAGPREVVVDGVTGYRAKPYELEDYVEKHARLIDDPRLRDSMGEAARRRVLDKFTWERHVDGLVKAIEGVA
jgi:glycosyltransferase involved in cell wall biosynthesis